MGAQFIYDSKLSTQEQIIARILLVLMMQVEAQQAETVAWTAEVIMVELMFWDPTIPFQSVKRIVNGLADSGHVRQHFSRLEYYELSSIGRAEAKKLKRGPLFVGMAIAKQALVD